MKLFQYIILIFPLLFISCEEEKDFGFPSGIEISADGQSVVINGKNDLPPDIVQIELLDYNGDGNCNGRIVEDSNCIETTNDWLTVKYLSAEYKLVVIAEPNKTNKKRKHSL